MDEQRTKHRPSREMLQKGPAVSSCGSSPAPHQSQPHDISPATRGYPLLGIASCDTSGRHAEDLLAPEMTARRVPTANKWQVRTVIRSTHNCSSIKWITLELISQVLSELLTQITISLLQCNAFPSPCEKVGMHLLSWVH